MMTFISDKTSEASKTSDVFMEANRHFMAEIVWPHFWLIQIWLTVLFFVYCALRELVRAIGRDKVIHMFFGSNKDGV